MNERDGGLGRFERETTQRRLEEVLDVIATKMSQHVRGMQRLNTTGDLPLREPMTDEALEAVFGRHTMMQLPPRYYGMGHNLDIQLIAANPHEGIFDEDSTFYGREDDVAEIVHRQDMSGVQNPVEWADVFIISTDTDGKLLLEKTKREYSREYIVASEYEKLLEQQAGEAEIDEMFTRHSNDEVMVRQAATRALKDMRQLGVSAATEEELGELEILLWHVMPVGL